MFENIPMTPEVFDAYAHLWANTNPRAAIKTPHIQTAKGLRGNHLAALTKAYPPMKPHKTEQQNNTLTPIVIIESTYSRPDQREHPISRSRHIAIFWWHMSGNICRFAFD